MPRGPHVFVTPADVSGSAAVVTGDEAHHLATVLRVRRGDAVSVADGTGAVYDGRVAAVAGRTVTVDLLDRQVVGVPTPRVVVVHALPKGRKLDEVVQRLSEIGVDRLVPVHSDRSQVRLEGDRAAKALRRWRAVALAAAKQSRRPRLLEVAEVGTWREAFADGVRGAVLWEEATAPLRTVVDGLRDADEVVLAVGPEGGLTADEVAASGLPAVGLGPTILRTETAALVGASLLLHGLGRLG
ncbi:MAG TPA: RsmE family RNA methyltransferase [Egibacteraceae bacterium]